MPIKMIASRRHYRLEERRQYEKGETLLVKDEREAGKLERLRKAIRVPVEHQPNPTDLPKQAAVKPTPEPDIAALRSDYEALVGKRPFMGWGEDDLREKMATYRRRDLTAADYETKSLDDGD